VQTVAAMMQQSRQKMHLTFLSRLHRWVLDVTLLVVTTAFDQYYGSPVDIPNSSSATSTSSASGTFCTFDQVDVNSKAVYHIKTIAKFADR
jgi:hypothetical protein